MDAKAGAARKQRTSLYRAALAGVVELPALMECSLADFGRRLAGVIRRETADPLPDYALLEVLCDAARLGDEIIISLERQDWSEGPADEALPCGGAAERFDDDLDAPLTPEEEERHAKQERAAEALLAAEDMWRGRWVRTRSASAWLSSPCSGTSGPSSMPGGRWRNEEIRPERPWRP